MTSDTEMNVSLNLEHGFGLGHDFGHDFGRGETELHRLDVANLTD